LKIEFISWILNDLKLINHLSALVYLIFLFIKRYLLLRINLLSLIESLVPCIPILIAVNFTCIQYFLIISVDWGIIVRVSAFPKLELSTIGTEAAGILLILIPFGPLVHILVSRREILMSRLVFFVTTWLIRRLWIIWIMKELTVIHPQVTASRAISARA